MSLAAARTPGPLEQDVSNRYGFAIPFGVGIVAEGARHVVLSPGLVGLLQAGDGRLGCYAKDLNHAVFWPAATWPFLDFLDIK